MLKQVRVTNFKVIADSTLLPLQPFTALIGRNGSGKSSLIEALDWLGRAIHEGAEAATEPFQRITDILGGWKTDSTRTFSITLVLDPDDASVGEEVLYRVEVGVDDSGELPRVVAEELSVKRLDVDQIRDVPLIRTDESTRWYLTTSRATSVSQPMKLQEGDQFGMEMTQQPPSSDDWRPITDPDRLALSYIDPIEMPASRLLKDYLERSVFLRLSPRAIASFVPGRNKRSPRLLDDEGQKLACLLEELDQETLSILVEKLSYIIPGASHVDAHRPGSPADRHYFTLVESRAGEEQSLPVPAWVLSEGTRRITAILAVLLHPSPPPLICIEEVENGLDPWTLKYLLEELSGAVERNTQVMVTTHSPYLLDMLGRENIILCDRLPYGVEFHTADKLPEGDVLQTMLGLGSLYTNRYLYPKTGAESEP